MLQLRQRSKTFAIKKRKKENTCDKSAKGLQGCVPQYQPLGCPASSSSTASPGRHSDQAPQCFPEAATSIRPVLQIHCIFSPIAHEQDGGGAALASFMANHCRKSIYCQPVCLSTSHSMVNNKSPQNLSNIINNNYLYFTMPYRKAHRDWCSHPCTAHTYGSHLCDTQDVVEKAHDYQGVMAGLHCHLDQIGSDVGKPLCQRG